MRKTLVVLGIVGVLSAPAVAQTAPATTVQPAKPLTVKKRICEITEEDSYSRLGGRKICHTVEVPAPVQAPQQPGAQQPAQQPTGQQPQVNSGR